MTCIVGLEHNGRVWLGGDSAAVGGMDLRIRADPKVFFVDDVLFGFTSSFRMGQLLRFSLEIPHQAIDSDYRYLCTDFIDAVRKCLKEGGFASVAEEEGLTGEEQGGNFLVGYRGKLYNVQSDYQVGIPKIPFDACGCGESYALGSLMTTAKSKMGPKARIIQALTTATSFSAGVSPPFSIIFSKKYRR